MIKHTDECLMYYRLTKNLCEDEDNQDLFRDRAEAESRCPRCKEYKPIRYRFPKGDK